jgi:hypothetical protein
VKAVTPLLGELVAQALIGLGGERPTLFIRYRSRISMRYIFFMSCLALGSNERIGNQ